MLRAVLPALALLVSAGEAAAQWRFVPGPVGMSASAISGPGVPAATLSCTRPGFDKDEWGRRAGETHAPYVTDPGAFALLIDAGGLPAARDAAEAEDRTEAALVADVDGAAFGLRAEYDPLLGAFAATVPAQGGLVDALMKGATARFSVEGHPHTVPVQLAGSSRSIAELRTFCAAPLGRAADGVAATEAPASVRLAHPEALDIAWFERPEDAGEALAFIYAPSGGNAATLDVILFRETAGFWAEAGRVEGVFGASPHDAAFGADAIEVTTTTLKPGDPRCCPTGETRYVIDRATLRAHAEK